MARKIYKANSVISFPITYPDGHYERIKFLPYSMGGSIFVTDNEKKQEMLEKTKGYGSRFVLFAVEGETKNEEKEITPEPVKELTKVTVSDIAEAKQYLVDNYGISKAKLRSSVVIKAVAEQNGIEFVIE